MNNQAFIQQLESVVNAYESLRAKAKNKDLSDQPKDERQAVVTQARASVTRVSGPQSPYSLDIERLIKESPYLHTHTSSVLGVAKALLADLRAGYVQSLVETAHADVFGDFLEMATHLLESGFKDASAVIAGSSLEAHLRALCLKNGIDVEITKNGKQSYLKADAMNAALAKNEVYGKLYQKSITAWLDLRNKAAHGQYADYQTEQVTLLIGGVRDFIGTNPA